jgi:hypothetical protein
MPIEKNSLIDNQPKGSRGSFLPGSGVLLTAFLAMVTVYLFRAGHSRGAAILWVELALFACLPIALLYLLRTWLKNDSDMLRAKDVFWVSQCGAILVGAAVVVWHRAILPFGFGSASEIVALTVLQSVGWYLAVFSRVRGFEKASVLLSGALIFFVCCMSDQVEVFVVTAVFAFAGLWWLLAQYWSQLEAKSIDGESRMLRLHVSAVSLTAVAMGLAICAAVSIPFAQSGIFDQGFMPFSGGENGWQDEFAISGVGDGEMLAAGNNATTTGAVDSNQFIEDHKPSIYDVTTEKYDGPVGKRRRVRTVSLDLMAKHLHEVKQSEQAGRTFRTMRNSDKTTDIKLEDRITKALFFVEGSTPARFVTNRFQRFDGWDWTNGSPDEFETKFPKITLDKRSGIPVYRIAQDIPDFLTGRRSHRVKIMRLDINTIPAPALVSQWHIPYVDTIDMFHWNEVGLVQFDGDCIPTHTVIDVQSLVPNYHLLRSDVDFEVPSTEQFSRSPGLQIPEDNAKSAIHSLVSDWTLGIRPGWTQVESIVGHVRNDYQLDSAWKTDDQAESTVQCFLDNGGGPSYMFATTCAMALRSAGYKTRLASGFLVQEKDYDYKARQSIVTASNLHVWPEVCLDGRSWMAVEPTPGYPAPFSVQTTWQWATAQAWAILHWVKDNPIQTAVSVCLSCCALVFRAELITWLMLLWWLLVRFLWPQALLKTTRQLIDLRFWLAGDRRPASETIGDWCRRVEPTMPGVFFDLWNAKNFSGRTPTLSHEDLAVACQGFMKSLTLKKIKDFLALPKKANKP